MVARSAGAAVGSRADEQRQRILAAAVGVFSRRGYRATSMNDIAAGVGLSKPALYHYVRTKQDLLVQVYEEVLDESLRSARAIVAAAPSPLEAVRGLIVERVAYTCEHQDLLKICFEEESELPPELAEPILARRRAFEAVVLEAVGGAPRGDGAGAPDGAQGLRQHLPRRRELGLQVVRPGGLAVPARAGGAGGGGAAAGAGLTRVGVSQTWRPQSDAPR